MRVVDVVTGKRARMARHLGFEDFMEVRSQAALCRCSSLTLLLAT